MVGVLSDQRKVEMPSVRPSRTSSIMHSKTKAAIASTSLLVMTFPCDSTCHRMSSGNATRQTIAGQYSVQGRMKPPMPTAATSTPP